MRRACRCGIVGLLAVVLAAASLPAQDDGEDEESVELRPGVKAVYRAPDGRPLLERWEPVPRLFGDSKDSAHSKVPAAGFRARWSGRLRVPFDGQYTFSLREGSPADLRLTLAGRPVRFGEPVALEFGNVPFELSGVHQRGDRLALALGWENEFFAPEVLNARWLGHLPSTSDSPEIARQSLEDSGAALAESFGCFRCHQGPGPWVQSLAEGVGPELLLPGPRLVGTGRRLHRQWVSDFLQNPAAHRPGTRMPAQLKTADGTDGGRSRFSRGEQGTVPFRSAFVEPTALEVIVAYLTSGQTAEVAEASPAGSPERGLEVYRDCGCAACHEPPEGTLSARGVPPRVPSLDRLAEKWTVPGLAAFLANPLDTRPHGRMPDFSLSARDADDLTAYLLTRQGAGEPPPFVPLPGSARPVAADARSLVDPAGLVLWLPLDERSGRLVDRSGREHHGSATGRVGYAAEGRNDGALRFDPGGGHVVIDGSGELDTSGDFTWAAWIRTTGSGAIFGRAPERGVWVQGGKTLFVRNGRLCFDVGWVGVVTSETKVNDDRWHHVAVTVTHDTDDDLDTVVLYVDGRPDAVKNDWNVGRFQEKEFVLKLGRAATNFPQKQTFAGWIDEAAMWTRCLAPEEVAALGEGNAHLAATEAALFSAGALKARWIALGQDPAALDRFGQGLRLKAVALAEMAAVGCLNCHDAGVQSQWPLRRRAQGPPVFGEKTAGGGARQGTVPFWLRENRDRLLVGLSPDRLDAGCLASVPAGGPAPRFDFSVRERAALREYVKSLTERNSPSLAEAMAVEMKLLGCTACHQNEGEGGEALVAVLGGPEAARFLTPPSLSGVAARLLADRLDQLVTHGAEGRPMRPWVAARMPGFGRRGSRMARRLCVRDGVRPPPPPPLVPVKKKKDRQPERPAVPQNQVELGRLLVSNKGLTCVNCHAVAGRKPSGEVDPSTRSPDLARFAGYLRRDYFERLLRDPGRVFPGTKMPVIFPRQGPGLVPALRDLPQEALAQALWNYLSLGKKAPPPSEEEPAELLPSVLRVSVQRGPTYVGEALFGRGITCGFPTGTLLFDADALEPAAIWFDGFLNRVPTTYFGLNWRCPGDFELLGDGRHLLVYRRRATEPWREAPLPLECDPNTASRFGGYTIGRHEITFRYRLLFDGCRVQVSDSLRIDQREAWRGFVRRLSVEGLPEGAQVAWTLPKGENLQFFTAAGAAVEHPDAAARAPVAVFWIDGRAHAIRAQTEGGSWQLGAADAPLRLVSAEAAGGRAVRLRIDWWTRREAGGEPSTEQLASLCDPALLEPAYIENDARPRPLPELRPRRPEPEEPFTYKLEPIPGPPEGWRPSGTAFTSDGTMYAVGLTEGRVYRARIPPVPVPDDFQWQLYATGLNVPTGMNVVDDRLFVSHRPEVTELVDADGDGTVETFRTVMGPWSLADGFHEYAFGLAVDRQKHLYVALNNGYFWSYGGPTHRGRHRSAVMRCDLAGHSEEWGRGCRVPNGICRGPGGDIFYVDNQGDWIQVCKIVQCRKGAFYGHPETEDEFLPEGDVPSGLTSVWIPYNVIRSAAALRMDDTGGRFGPFAGQMFVGDTGYGQSVNIMRVALEKVEGVWQGAAFRFIDGPPRGPEHTTFGPDGQMYVSCLTDGVVRIRYGGRRPMEIHHVSLRRDGGGFVLFFTKPIAADSAREVRKIRARRWYYPYGIRYGSPRYEEVDVPIRRATVSADRMSIDLELSIKTYKNGMVYYFNVGKLRAADGEPVGHPEAWYTLQRVWDESASDLSGAAAPRPGPVPPAERIFDPSKP